MGRIRTITKPSLRWTGLRFATMDMTMGRAAAREVMKSEVSSERIMGLADRHVLPRVDWVKRARREKRVYRAANNSYGSSTSRPFSRS